MKHNKSHGGKKSLLSHKIGELYKMSKNMNTNNIQH